MPQAKQPWEYEIAPCYSKSTAEKIFKKHPQEFQNVLKNLDTYKKTLDEGVPLEQVKVLLGHSNIDTTMIYALTDNNEVKLNHKRLMD